MSSLDERLRITLRDRTARTIIKVLLIGTALCSLAAGLIHRVEAQSVGYSVHASFWTEVSEDDPLCPGEVAKIEAWVQRAVPDTTRDGTATVRIQHVSGINITADGASHGRIRAVDGVLGAYIPTVTTGAGRFLPDGAYTDKAIFEYVAEEPGKERLDIETAFNDRSGNLIYLDTTLEFEVKDCPLNTSMIYQGYFQGEGFALASTGWMDEVELTPVDEQHYAGSGTFYMNTIYMIPGCSLSHTTYTVLTTINAVSSEETLALTFESEVGEVILSGQCGGYGLSAVQPAASLADFGLSQVTVPPDGGVVNVPSSPFPGTFTIIVTREAEREAIPVSDAGDPAGGLPAWLILADTSQ